MGKQSFCVSYNLSVQSSMVKTIKMTCCSWSAILCIILDYSGINLKLYLPPGLTPGLLDFSFKSSAMENYLTEDKDRDTDKDLGKIWYFFIKIVVKCRDFDVFHIAFFNSILCVARNVNTERYCSFW